MSHMNCGFPYGGVRVEGYEGRHVFFFFYCFYVSERGRELLKEATIEYTVL